MPRGKLPDEEKHIRVSISFSPEQHAQLLRYCQMNERSMSWVIRKALAEWFEKSDLVITYKFFFIKSNDTLAISSLASPCGCTSS